MKKAIIYFEGKEVTDFLCDEVSTLDGSHYFNLRCLEVSVFPVSCGYVLTDYDSQPIITEEQKENIKEIIKKEFTI